MSLLRRSFLLGLGAGAARLLGAGILIVLARVLGVERFGIFGYAMSVALLLEVIIDMGQSVHLGRVVARDPEDGPSAFGDVALNKLVVTAVLSAGAYLLTRVVSTSAEEAATVALMVVWGGFLSILNSERAIGRALDRFGQDSLVNSAESVGRLLGVLAAWGLGLGLAGYGAAFALECGIAALAFYLYLSRGVRLLPDRASLAGSLRFLKTSVPLGLSGIAVVGFYQIDQVLVRILAGPAANGLYGAATRVVFAANTLGALVVLAGYPELARLHEDFAGFRHRFWAMVRLAGSVSAAVTVVTMLLARPVVAVLYGAEYAGTIPLLRILAPVVLFDALVVAGIYAGNALGREKRVLGVVATLFAANVLANALLVPTFGAAAAAWISVTGEALLAVGLLGVSWDRIAGPMTAPIGEAAHADS